MSNIKSFLNKLRLIKQVILSKPVKHESLSPFDCPVCGNTQVTMHNFPIYYFIEWQKHQTVHNPFFIETMNIEHYMCSKCFAFDRERLIALYIKDYLAIKIGLFLCWI